MLGKIIKITNQLLFNRNLFDFLTPTTLIKDEEQSLINTAEVFESEVYEGRKVITFASARMAFYSIMSVLNIGKNDEVLLTGFTCSVMANAVLRRNATPVYTDIDLKTFGTCLNDVKNKVSARTKVIVVQHTFGIPCDVGRIVEYAHQCGIFVIEDCAITYGSTINGMKCGTIGDFAISSTDHTKPFSSVIGGYAVVNNNAYYDALKDYHDMLPELSSTHQNAVKEQFLQDNYYQKHPKLFLLSQYFGAIKKKLGYKGTIASLTFDSSSSYMNHGMYPYPAKMSNCIANIALHSLREHKNRIPLLKEHANEIISILKDYGEDIDVYEDCSRDIVPLRIIYNPKHKVAASLIKQAMIDWIWFKSPIVYTNEPIESFGYHKGDCPNSEKISGIVMNIPLYTDEAKHRSMLHIIKKAYSQTCKQ